MFSWPFAVSCLGSAAPEVGGGMPLPASQAHDPAPEGRRVGKGAYSTGPWLRRRMEMA